ncbi:GNAT family N-acetyltransferase [Paenibacillus sp.]|jgi:ribosomal protein S18 acetylase RimI-like enzyme|uniref:GNAT family N-acetyltransferase n=1 Tax=Paenibacillus sp. TaxID=58172 RepID=UPI002824F11D|nr:GNAT family N-acetyltransferase [Paenibacillus sp.]MDR0266525.1 GNAT family N-acetyltransferase [Paenibacillus sp.]
MPEAVDELLKTAEALQYCTAKMQVQKTLRKQDNMITIRHITEKDLSGLSHLYEELLGISTHLDQMLQVFKSAESSGNYHILGAFHEGELAGSLMGIVCLDLIGNCKPFMVIENVIVSGRIRRQGIGQKLMNEIEKIARENGCGYIILVSGEQRKEAHIFYEKLGYRDEKVEGFRKHLH